MPEERFAIRRWHFDDIEPLYEAVHESLNELSRWMPWCHPGYSGEDAATWVLSRSEAWQEDREYDFVICERTSGRFVGACGLNHLSRSYRLANLGYWVRSKAAGQGAATAAARQVARFGLETLGLERIEILVAVDNRPSRRVAEKLGAHKEGILRRRLPLPDDIHDAVLYSLIRPDLQLPSAPRAAS